MHRSLLTGGRYVYILYSYEYHLCVNKKLITLMIRTCTVSRVFLIDSKTKLCPMPYIQLC